MNTVAVKLTNQAVLDAVRSAEASLDDVSERAQQLADRIGAGLASLIFRGGSSNRALRTEIRPTLWPLDLEWEVTDSAWTYVEDDLKVVPVLGPQGDEARAELESVQPPAIQAPDVLQEAGLPTSVKRDEKSYTRTTWFIWDDAIYALVGLDEDGKNPTKGDWQETERDELFDAQSHFLQDFR